MADALAYHVGRSWVGRHIEDECPCPQEPCGLVRLDRADPSCLHHSVSRAKSMRQVHSPDRCPATSEPPAPAGNTTETRKADHG